MGLNIDKVHVMERDAGGRDVLVKSNPYARFVSSEGGTINVQGGRFYSSGAGQPVVPFEDVPDWAWKAVKAMSPEGRVKVGMPEDMSELQEAPDPESEVEQAEPAQPLGKQEEPEKTLVDHIHELDHSIDAHWTKGGLPDLNTLKELMGSYVSRGEVEAAAPGHKRKES